MLTLTYFKQRKKFEISLSESRVYKKWQTSAIIREVSGSHVETGRNGPKSGVSKLCTNLFGHNLLTEIKGLCMVREHPTLTYSTIVFNSYVCRVS